MFEKIVLRTSEDGKALSLGEMAEALLFYQHVYIILDLRNLGWIIRSIGIPSLLSLLSRPSVSAVYYEDIIATYTMRRGSEELYQFETAMLSGMGTPLESPEARLEYVIMREGYDEGQAKEFVQTFTQTVPIKKLTDDYPVEGGVLPFAKQALIDQDFISEAVRRVLSRELGTEILPSDFTFKIHFEEPWFYIETNLNLDDVNRRRRQTNPGLVDIGPAYLVHNILAAKSDMILASKYGSEFYTSSLTSEIIRLSYHELLNRIRRDLRQIEEFKEIVIPQGPSVRDVVNSGTRGFDEFLDLLDKSARFKDWIRDVDPDESVVRAYFDDISSQGWISKLPTRAFRYVLSGAVGMINPAAGLVVSAADSFLVDKILKGWRPNHFVERDLMTFTNPKEAV